MKGKSHDLKEEKHGKTQHPFMMGYSNKVGMQQEHVLPDIKRL